MAHTPNAVASRAEGGRKISEWRQANIHARPDAKPLRTWMRAKIRELGFRRDGTFARACGLPYGRITQFLAGRTQLLGRAAIEAIAEYTGAGVDALISLQAGYTAESRRNERARRMAKEFHEKYQKGHPIHVEASKKANEKRRPRENYPALVRAMKDPDVQKRANHNHSMAYVRKMAASAERPPWQRWVAEKMLDRDMSRAQLADALGLPVTETNYLLKRDHHSIVGKTLDRFERLFGPMPIDVFSSVKSATKQTKGRGGRAAQKKLRKRIEKWSRERLEEEIAKLFSPFTVPGSIKARLREARLGWREKVKAAGVDIYYAAKGERLFLARPAGPPRQSRRAVTLTPRGQLAVQLAKLEQGRADRFYQCQSCRSIWQKAQSKNKGMLCAPCWKQHDGRLASWRATGKVGPAPELPRRKGGRLMIPADIHQRIIAVLHYRLSGKGPASDESNEYRALSRTEKILAESLHPWCQRVTLLLAQL